MGKTKPEFVDHVVDKPVKQRRDDRDGRMLTRIRQHQTSTVYVRKHVLTSEGLYVRFGKNGGAGGANARAGLAAAAMARWAARGHLATAEPSDEELDRQLGVTEADRDFSRQLELVRAGKMDRRDLKLGEPSRAHVAKVGERLRERDTYDVDAWVRHMCKKSAS